MLRTIETIDKLVHLRANLYARGRSLALTESETVSLMESLPPRDKARLEYHRLQIDTANALAFDVLAGVARNRGLQRRAITLAHQAEALYRVLGRRYDVERMMISAITAAVQTGDTKTAQTLLQRNGTSLAASPSTVIRNELVARRADVLLALGRASESVNMHRDSNIISASRKAEPLSLTAGRLFLLAGAETETGNLRQAEEALIEGADLLRQDENDYFAVQHQLTSAAFLFTSGDSDGGGAALEAALDLAMKTGISLPQVKTTLQRFTTPDGPPSE